MSHQLNDQELYTLRALAEQAQNPNTDPRQVLHHLQANVDSMNQLQLQLGALQSRVQEQQDHMTQPGTQAPLVSLQAAIESIAAQTVQQQQLQQSFQANVQMILERLSQRSHTGPSRAPIPLPLSTKFKGNDDEMSFDEFKARLTTVCARFPESMSSDADKINFALQSMEGAPSRYFAPFVNGDVSDDDGILSSFQSFLSAIEDVYGDQHQLDDVNQRLLHLRQKNTEKTGMTSYISKFRSLASRTGWNESALLARFKDGLSPEVCNILTPQWHNLKTLKEAQSAATSAFQNIQNQQRNRTQPSYSKTSNHQHRRTQPSATPATAGPSPMDLDAVRVKRITDDEKNRRRAQGLCLYCGGANHFAAMCPKKPAQVAVATIDSGNESA